MRTAALGSDALRAACGPLDLIHRNKVPNPASMRVPGRLPLEDLSVSSLEKWLDFLAGPLGHLYLERRAQHAKSTR